MKSILLIKNKKIASLKKYLNYVLNWNVIQLTENQQNQTSSIIILIDEDIEINNQLLKKITKLNKYKIIVLGKRNINNTNYINILEITNFNNMLNKYTNNLERNLNDLFFIKSIEEKVDIFFKGHGKCSLFDGLNWTSYYISNGIKLYNRNKLNWKEFSETYLQPGIDYWGNFQNRFNKYKSYLIILGFQKEVLNIFKKVEDFNNFADILKKSDQKNVKKIDNNALKNNINILGEIDKQLNKIKNKVDEYKKQI